MSPITVFVVAILALVAGGVAGYYFQRYQTEQRKKNQQERADNILKGSNEQARLIESQSRENATKIIQAAESEIKERRIELNKDTERLDKFVEPFSIFVQFDAAFFDLGFSRLNDLGGVFARLAFDQAGLFI